MVAVQVFSSSVNYNYKTKICSTSAFVVFLFVALSALTPVFLVHNAGGFWLKNRIHAETADVLFSYEYLLLAERDLSLEPIVCSTFATYKENKISDDCFLIKVQEVDTNSDGKKDILKFEANFYTDLPVGSFQLLLFFKFQLKGLFQDTVESIAVLEGASNRDAREILFSGDLELYQRGPLSSQGLYQAYNRSLEVADYTLNELLARAARRKLSAKINNQRVTWGSAYSEQDPVVIRGELFYGEHLIYYQPGVWEELKWAWIQYLSFLLVFAYVAKRSLVFLFSNRYLNSYVSIPWRMK